MVEASEIKAFYENQTGGMRRVAEHFGVSLRQVQKAVNPEKRQRADRRVYERDHAPRLREMEERRRQKQAAIAECEAFIAAGPLLSRNAKIRMLRNAGATLREIEARVGISHEWVRQILIARGAP